MRSPAAVAALPRRDRLLIAGCILVVTVLAWAYLFQLHHQMTSTAEVDVMANMGMSMEDPWGAADVGFTLVMWSVMMIGMMATTATPVLLLFAATQTQRATERAKARVLLFALGYFLVWLGFSAAAALLQWGLHEAALLSPAMSAASPKLAGAILIGAGIYQLTPAKSACLRHCQSPLGFLMSNWRNGNVGALTMGLRHGLYCVGCCWAVMCVLFAVGIMNLAWVALLTVFILIEKLGPAGVRVARVGGVLIAALGVVVLTR